MVALRVLGAVALLAVGVVHIEQYFDVHFKVVPVIGTMFALNFVGATIVGLLLLAPIERAAGRRPGRGGALIALLVVLGIGIAAVSLVFLLVTASARRSSNSVERLGRGSSTTTVALPLP